MPAPRRTWGLKLFWRIHRRIYSLTNGRLGGRLFGRRILKLTTTGRRSGKSRSILIYYWPYSESYVIIGSNAGHGKHPAWYLNIQVNPRATAQVGTRRIAVRGRDAEGEERGKLWSEITAKDPSYLEYQDRTERRIPVVVLDPETDRDED